MIAFPMVFIIYKKKELSVPPHTLDFKKKQKNKIDRHTNTLVLSIWKKKKKKD